jgi:uncharacterized metal-binding protein YceD (DUF177 family)
MNDSTGATPEFSRIVSTHRLHAQPATYKIAAKEEERAALARRFGLISLDRLEAEITLERTGGEVRLDGAFEADLVQSCIVTLDPVPAKVGERFTILYRPDIDEDEADRLALDEPDEPLVEPLVGDAIDIGETVAQQLAVAMDPYPRAAGVEAVEIEFAGDPADSPFGKLAAFKKQ